MLKPVFDLSNITRVTTCKCSVEYLALPYCQPWQIYDHQYRGSVPHCQYRVYIKEKVQKAIFSLSSEASLTLAELLCLTFFIIEYIFRMAMEFILVWGVSQGVQSILDCRRPTPG